MKGILSALSILRSTRNLARSSLIGGLVKKTRDTARVTSRLVRKPKKTITEADIKRAARMLDCEPAAVRAVIEVESSGSGFLRDGRPKILFEAHHFSRLTNRKYDRSHPKISSRRWNRRLYLYGAREHGRLNLARVLDPEAAFQSASWGAFQIMGFHYKLLGFRNVQDFVEAMQDAGKQLDCFIKFVKAKKLDKHIRSRNWARFAYGYNGSGYKVNKYDVKIARAYQRHKLEEIRKEG